MYQNSNGAHQSTLLGTEPIRPGSVSERGRTDHGSKAPHRRSLTNATITDERPNGRIGPPIRINRIGGDESGEPIPPRTLATKKPMPIEYSPRMANNEDATPTEINSIAPEDGPRNSPKAPLLPITQPKYGSRSSSSTNLFIGLGAATLALQTAIFITLESISLRFPSYLYPFLAHEVFAVTFFLGTASFAFLPPGLLFSIGLLRNLNLLACVASIVIPGLVVLGAGQLWALIVILAIVGLVTILSVVMIPVVFTTASAISSDCPLYAASGQGFGTLLIACVGVILTATLGKNKSLTSIYLLCFGMYGVALVALTRIQANPSSARRLTRLSNVGHPRVDDRKTDVTTGLKSLRKSTYVAHSYRRNGTAKSFSVFLRGVGLQIICAFLATTVSFTLFPSFTVQLAKDVFPGFGVVMIAIFFASDQLGRHVPALNLALKPCPLFAFVLFRILFIPLFFISYLQWSLIFSGAVSRAALQAGLGFTQGLAIASAFRHIPSGSTKYEIERVQFYLSLSNSLGTAVGAGLLAVFVCSGWITI